MEEKCKKLSERILQLTLEIIYLLTGEDNIVAKKTSEDRRNPIMVPLHSLLIPERNNGQEILDVTKRIIELLTRESGNWSNFNVRIKEEIKEEEEEYGVMKEHKDLYKDVVMEDQPPLTSPDGSSNRIPPERCLHPLYSQDSKQEDLSTPYHDQGAEVIDIKNEVKEEETDMRENQSLKEDKMMVTITKEESSLNASTGGSNGWNNSDGRLFLSADSNKEDNDTTQYSPGISVVNQHINHKINHMVRSANQQIGVILRMPNINQIVLPQRSTQAFIVQINPSNPEESSRNNLHPLPDCEKPLILKHDAVTHQRTHTVEKPFPCSECEKSFNNKSNLIQHQRVHTGEKPFSCAQCGKSFSSRGNRDKHVRIHTGERPFSCLECGKRFAQKVTLIIHQKIHSTRMIHQRTYTTGGH